MNNYGKALWYKGNNRPNDNVIRVNNFLNISWFVPV